MAAGLGPWFRMRFPVPAGGALAPDLLDFSPCSWPADVIWMTPLLSVNRITFPWALAGARLIITRMISPARK